MVTQVKDQVTRNQYTATSGQTIFPYGFLIFVKTDITVEIGTIEQTVDVDYTVSGVANIDGGNITLLSGASSGDIVTVYRTQNFDREVDYQELGDFLSGTVNGDFNRIILMLQQLLEGSTRTIQYAVDDIVSTIDIPALALRKGALLGFDSSGNLNVQTLTGSTSTDGEVQAAVDRNLNQTRYELGSVAAVTSHPGISTGHIIKTDYRDPNRIAGSGSGVAYTGTELGSTDPKAGNWPDADKFFYDADAKQYLNMSNPLRDVQFGVTGDGSTADNDGRTAFLAALGTNAEIIAYGSDSVISAETIITGIEHALIRGGEVDGNTIYRLSGTTQYLTISDVRLVNGGDIVFVENTDTSADNQHLTIENAISESGDTIVSIRGGTHSGVISGSVGKELADRGIGIGWDDFTSQANWGPWYIGENLIDDVHPADSISHYGIITYSPFSIVAGNFVRDIGSDIGTDTEGIYTKAKFSTVYGNVLVDAGQGEAAINLKGRSKGDTGAPQGYNVTCVANNISVTAAYAAASPTNVSGIKCNTDNLALSANVIDGVSGYAVYTTGTEIDNLSINGHVLTSDQLDAALGMIGILCNGKMHLVTANIIDDFGATSTGVRIAGQTTATNVKVSANSIADALMGIVLKPTTDDVLDVCLTGNNFDNVGTVLSTQTAKIKSLVFTDNVITNLTSLIA
ncbi:MAG: hypothetical protein KAJ19_08160 [Gammaproteobacteria bacterium]|nr:hypothetical protein [Gammaproteobacteria bacterium]